MRRVRYCFLLENLVFNLFVLCVSERNIFQFSNTFTCLLLFSLVGLGVVRVLAGAGPGIAPCTRLQPLQQIFAFSALISRLACLPTLF